MAQTTDLQPRVTRPLTAEVRACAGWVLGTIAQAYATDRPTTPVDLLDFPVRIGAAAYSLVGETPQGGTAEISRAARAAAGEIEDGITRGELALRLRRVATDLGCKWDDNEPMIPKELPRLPIPGPRRTPEDSTAVSR
jgi:hypothetical protein